MEKRHCNTVFDRLMTEAPTRMFGLIIFILRTELEKLKTVSRVRQTLWNVSKKKNSGVAEHLTC